MAYRSELKTIASKRAKKRQRRRKRLLKRGGDQCARCGSTEDLTIDHKTPKSRGGGNGKKNLQVLCRECNQAKGSMTEEEWKMVRKITNSKR